MTIQKKFLSLILVLAMALSLVPAFSVSAFADATPNYLTFTAEEDNSSVTFSWASGSDVMYSTKASISAEWSEFTTYNANSEVKLASGEAVRFKGTNVITNFYNHFSMSGKIAASGDVTSLTNGVGADATLTQSCYYEMFYDCTSLTTAPELPATTLADSCYSGMFIGCTSLTTAPALPATTLASYCYYGMFKDCTLLTSAPELHATTLADRCYHSMFQGCTSLISAPELSATTVTSYCYYQMFKDCTLLTSAPELPATKLAENCYSYMFNGCTSLTIAPELPATTLAENCYSSMFSGCTALISAPALSATELAKGCYMNMFKGCASLTIAPELPATTLAGSCYSYMFKGCTSLRNAPELWATTVANDCFQGMFNGCTSLTTAPELKATEMADYCYFEMFRGCTSLTSAPALKATTLADNCYKNMFYGCTKLYVTTCEAVDATWTIPASTATTPALNMTTLTAIGSATVEVPTTGTNYYKVTAAKTIRVSDDSTTGVAVQVKSDLTKAVKDGTLKTATPTDLATATDLEIIASVKEATEADLATATDLKNKVSSKNPIYYNIRLIATATDLATATDIIETGDCIIELIIPYNTSGKAIEVYRYHNGVDKFDQTTDAACTTDKAFYIEDEGTEDSKVHIFTNKFSIYAICEASSQQPTYYYYYTPDAYNITLGTFKNGSVTASKSSAYAGDTVTLTVKADKGWTLETITVTDKNGKEIELTAVNIGESYTFVMPSGAVSIAATFMEDNTMLNFCVDVNADDEYYDAVLWAYENGVTTGTDSLHFSPKASTTRGEMITFLWRAAGSPVVNYAMPFEDVAADEYYTEAVRWAASTGVTDGIDATHFAPEQTVSRAEEIAFLWKYAGKIQFANMTAEGPAPSPFTDVETDAYYYSAVLWAKAEGITNGTSETTFSPADSCLRYQAVTFLYKYFAK